MYKLFLCFRYLTRKGIVVFPILAVWLCVLMLIVVNSIMTGFVNRVRNAGRGLMGDVVIQSRNMAGFPYYRQLEKKIGELPQVAASTPVITAYGLLNLPEFQADKGVEIVGIHPAGKTRCSAFGKSLFWQHQAPLEAVKDLDGIGFPVTRAALLAEAHKRLVAALAVERKKRRAYLALKPIPSSAWFASLRRHWQVIAREDYRQSIYSFNRAYRDLRFVKQLPRGVRLMNRRALIQALVPAVPSLRPPPRAVDRYGTVAAMPKNGCIVGVDIGLYRRNRFGHYHRPAYVRFAPAILTVVPVTIKGTLAMPQSRRFLIVDDSDTKVFSVDSKTVYAPFRVVQKMAFMQKQELLNGGFRPAHCSQIQIRIHDDSNPRTVRAARNAIAAVVARFERLHPEMAMAGLQVKTWDQMQAEFIHAVDKERDLITFLLGLMSLVVVIVIFLIFYMIVRDKTRDIGIIKAIGGSEFGVGGIFVLYGMLISAAGALLGLASGVAFVRNDNWIHDDILWRIFGISIWNRRIYIFSRIPDQVNPHAAAAIVILAIAAGLLGALIPAFIAAARDPVAALRYE